MFSFDREVEPILDIIVGKTLEQALLEVEEETELDAIEERKVGSCGMLTVAQPGNLTDMLCRRSKTCSRISGKMRHASGRWRCRRSRSTRRWHSCGSVLATPHVPWIRRAARSGLPMPARRLLLQLCAARWARWTVRASSQIHARPTLRTTSCRGC